jgi:hypothetical protein
MTTVTVLATSPDLPQTANTSLLTGNSFRAGELPVDSNVQINVLLRDVSSRLVGVGQAAELVDIVGNTTTKLSIPVRRPFIYASSGSMLMTFDPTLDPRDAKFQGSLAGLTTPQVAVSVGGDRLVVGGPSSLQVVDTATHKVIGAPIALPAGATLTDLAPVPRSHRVAVAHSMGITIVNIDDQSTQTAMVGAVDRIAVGPAANGKMVAYGLVGRATPPDSPLSTCSGASSVVAVFVDTPAATPLRPLGQAVSAIAAAPDGPMVFATLPCAGQVARIDGDPTTEVAQLSLTKVTILQNAAVLAVLGDRVFAAGASPSAPVCASSSGNQVPCSSTTQVACPEPNANHLSYVTTGSHLIVQSIPLDGGTPITLDLPERRETIVNTDDQARQHTQVLHSLGITPLDLVALPGAQYVSVVARSSYYIESLSDGLGTKLLPCLQATVGDWLLMDMASSSIAQRVRTQCQLKVGPGAFFRTWECDAAPEGEKSTVGDYMPASVGALFGAR